jgi:hypothetical protein
MQRLPEFKLEAINWLERMGLHRWNYNATVVVTHLYASGGHLSGSLEKSL